MGSSEPDGLTDSTYFFAPTAAMASFRPNRSTGYEPSSRFVIFHIKTQDEETEMNKKNAHKKSQIALAATIMLLITAADASAQTATVYGLIDVAVERINNVAGVGSITRMPGATASMPSYWGVRGSDDLGDGLKATYVLEGGFAPDTGALGQAGRLFGRQAYVGLSGSWGAITMGRQYSNLYWALTDSNVIGPMSMGIGALDAYIPNARVDNAIAYRGNFDGLALGGTFSLGRDSANPTPNNAAGTNCGGESASDRKACRAVSLMAKYDRPTWGAAAAMDRMNGGSGSWAAAGLTSSSLSDQRVLVNGYYKFDALKVAGGWMRRNNEGSVSTPRSDLYYFGISYPFNGNFYVDAQIASLRFDGSDKKANLAILRGTYRLSKRTAAYMAVGRISNGGTSAVSVSAGSPGSNPVAGGRQSGMIVGLRHSF